MPIEDVVPLLGWFRRVKARIVWIDQENQGGRPGYQSPDLEASQMDRIARDWEDFDRNHWRCQYLDDGSKPALKLSVFENMHRTSRHADYWTKILDRERQHVTSEPRKVTIYSDELLREDVALEVPLQIKHTTTNPVISSSQASVPCTELGVEGLLSELNGVMRTSYSQDVPGLLPILQDCIEREYDFGAAFGRLRRYWFNDFAQLQRLLEEDERTDTRARESVLDRDHMVVANSDIPPRRFWDLYSNRVVPHWVTRFGRTHLNLWAISHSWVEESQRQSVATPINSYEWHVPIPGDTTLDRVRVEMLNLGAEYVWLDALCLRQEDSAKPEMETPREEEWRLDVPTIGNVYRSSVKVVTYFEGLGRPFHLGDVNGDRHWINRTWTLQEADGTTLVGGIIPRSPFPPHSSSDLDDDTRHFYTTLGAMFEGATRDNVGWGGQGLFVLLDTMLRRRATFRMDKVAGLACLLRSKTLPAYSRGGDTEDDLEEAWRHLANMMTERYRLDLIFLYPVPGDGKCTWRPTWRQLTSATTPLPHAQLTSLGVYPWTQTIHDDDSIEMKVITLNRCTIRCLDKPNEMEHCGHGTVVVTLDGVESSTSTGVVQPSFTGTPHHRHRILDGEGYVLVGFTCQVTYHREISRHWMIGRYVNEPVFGKDLPRIEKISVLELDRQYDDLGSRYPTLRESGLLEERDVIIV
ncbi:hypothetical protein NM688_g9004 [Phlebia brevispora]|uniref:Uncharacterized protein n=1 Tax=Phlebia brevispora TaxID=194682 RepID=A0ACC1RLQ5_9APHY|nr:hypothetical protein NM688_g9004 [Phlebia brevispora]